MDPAKKRQIRLVVALSAAVLLSVALIYTSFNAANDAMEPSELLAAGPGTSFDVTGKVAAGPEIVARGFVEDDDVFDEVRPQIEQALDAAAAQGVTDPYQLQQVIRRTVGGWAGKKIRRRPMILPTVIEA